MAEAKTSYSSTNADFSAMLRKRVNEYFVSTARKPTGNIRLYIKTAILVLTAASCYIVLITQIAPIWVDILVCTLFGTNLAAIGFNLMHEGAHGTYSGKRWVNEIMAFSLNVMGGNAYLWKQKHNVNHHSFTNIEGLDDDIDIKPWFRTNNNQPKHWFHRYQHIYWVLLYGFTYLIWVFSLDFKKYFTGKLTTDVTLKKMKPKEHFEFWISKILYLFFFLVLPVFMVGFLKTLIGYLITSFVCGWLISVVFQLAHLVEGADFPVPNEQTQQIEHDWTVHQLLTTANFANKSKIVLWFTGGLNFQIEHHLFPKISHVHYPMVSKLVREVCLQYNIRYTEYPTVLSAVRSHVSFMKEIGRK